ncbi:hypothetical protein mRhiFer1_009692 [Rhinolophus ferrumequinum]|uniref:Uncharacterized protein n=1 Tax=Rhinolophus ferrumequinum TaxID=59479 RepID=A0A7J7R109_RHIFE|nr:hypothetical protein mRhiFer1_009692 [Rhinolophus ferrumequinum]
MEDRQARSGLWRVIMTGQALVGGALPVSGRFLWMGAPFSERPGSPFGAWEWTQAGRADMPDESLWSATPQAAGAPGDSIKLALPVKCVVRCLANPRFWFLWVAQGAARRYASLSPNRDLTREMECLARSYRD